jgi:hypothetical protein
VGFVSYAGDVGFACSGCENELFSRRAYSHDQKNRNLTADSRQAGDLIKEWTRRSDLLLVAVVQIKHAPLLSGYVPTVVLRIILDTSWLVIHLLLATYRPTEAASNSTIVSEKKMMVERVVATALLLER